MVMDIFMSFVWSQQKEDTQMYSTALASYQQVNRFPVELSTEVDAGVSTRHACHSLL